jgi:hypothetical protein
MSPNAEYTTQPSYEEAPVAKQPMSKMNMSEYCHLFCDEAMRIKRPLNCGVKADC